MKQIINDMKSNKLLAIMYTFSFVILAIIIISVTYAYFESQSLDSGIVDVDAEFGLLDEYLITGGNPLSLNVTPTILPEDGNNQVVTTTAQVSLKKNPAQATDLTKEYYVYFKITNNYFIRTNPLKPEIVLNVYLNNQEVTISSLTQVTEGLVTGYDVTEENGVIAIAVPQTITSTSSDTATVQNWEFKLTYLNLDSDQSTNIGASFNAEVMINKEEYTKFTGTIYRNNDIRVIAGLSIEPITGTQWVITDGEEDFLNYDDQATCNAELIESNAPNEFYCEEKYGTFGGVGSYVTSVNNIRHESDVYCAYNSVEDENSCDSGISWSTQTECENYLTANNISNTTCMIGELNRNVYLKHEVEDDIIKTMETCLWYNNHEFCLGPDYWVEDDTNGTATSNKLQTAMETALGTQSRGCYPSSRSVICYFDDYACSANTNGVVSCDGFGTSCEFNTNGSSYCRYEYGHNTF